MKKEKVLEIILEEQMVLQAKSQEAYRVHKYTQAMELDYGDLVLNKLRATITTAWKDENE